MDIDAATLDPAAVIAVQLQDVSRTDAPAEIVSVQVITSPASSTAIPFTVYYDPYAIDPAHHYQLAARVTVSDEVQYASTDQYPVLTAGQLSGVAMKAEAHRSGRCVTNCHTCRTDRHRHANARACRELGRA